MRDFLARVDEVTTEVARQRAAPCASNPRRHPVNPVLFLMIPGAPTPVAPFSHAVEVDGCIFLTGQMPTDPNDAAPLPIGIEAQTRRVMDNLVLVLEGARLGLERVVAARAFLTDFERDYDFIARRP